MPGHSFAFGIGYPELIVNCSAMYPLETVNSHFIDLWQTFRRECCSPLSL